LERELSEPDRICVGIAASEDVLIAVSCGWVVLDELQITVLAVDPEQRRRGLGRAVLQKLLVDASNAGVRQAILDVAEGQSRGQLSLQLLWLPNHWTQSSLLPRRQGRFDSVAGYTKKKQTELNQFSTQLVGIPALIKQKPALHFCID
jgi:ribosomal protein S18 acetylase RimI-like enzyme